MAGVQSHCDRVRSAERRRPVLRTANANVKTAGVGSASVDWRLFNQQHLLGATHFRKYHGHKCVENGTAIAGGGQRATQSLRLTANAVTGASFSSWSNGDFVGGDPNSANPSPCWRTEHAEHHRDLYDRSEPDDHRDDARSFQCCVQLVLCGRRHGELGLAVTYSSAGSCTNTGATFTITSATSTCTVKYDQAGERQLQPGAQVTESVTAVKVNQTITFAALRDKTFGDADSERPRLRVRAGSELRGHPEIARSVGRPSISPGQVRARYGKPGG